MTFLLRFWKPLAVGLPIMLLSLGLWFYRARAESLAGDLDAERASNATLTATLATVQRNHERALAQIEADNARALARERQIREIRNDVSEAVDSTACVDSEPVQRLLDGLRKHRDDDRESHPAPDAAALSPIPIGP